MAELFIIMGICTALVIATIVMFYELHYVAGSWLNRYFGGLRYLIVLSVIISFACHTIAVWMYALSYYWITNHSGMGLGELHGEIHPDGLLSYVYFSATTYSTLGFGDVYPSGALRLLVAVEGINGLLLIGWSVTYTYVLTDRLFAKRQRKD